MYDFERIGQYIYYLKGLHFTPCNVVITTIKCQYVNTYEFSVAQSYVICWLLCNSVQHRHIFFTNQSIII